MSVTQATHSDPQTKRDKQTGQADGQAVTRDTQWGGVGSCVSLICTKKINTYKTATLGSFTYVHSDLEFNELSSGSSSIITASVIILVVGFP